MHMELVVIMFGGVFTIALCVYLIKTNKKWACYQSLCNMYRPYWLSK